MKRRTYSFEELDSTDEIVDSINNMYLDFANAVEAIQTEIERINDKISKKNGKKKGFVMKDTLIGVAVLAIIGGLLFAVAQAGYVQSDISYEIASNPELLEQYLRDTIGTVDVFRLTPTSEPTTQLLEGQIYYD